MTKKQVKESYIENIKDYPASARSIALHLEEFCDESMPYPAMVCFAAREANREIERLRLLLDKNKVLY